MSEPIAQEAPLSTSAKPATPAQIAAVLDDTTLPTPVNTLKPSMASLGTLASPSSPVVKVVPVYEPTRTNLPASPERYDQRVLWLKLRVRCAFTLHDDSMFIECLERDNRYCLAELMDFLEGVALPTSVLFYLIPGQGANVNITSLLLFLLILFY